MHQRASLWFWEAPEKPPDISHASRWTSKLPSCKSALEKEKGRASGQCGTGSPQHRGDCPSLALRSIVKNASRAGALYTEGGDIRETANRRGRIGGFTRLVLRDRTGDAPRRDRAR